MDINVIGNFRDMVIGSLHDYLIASAIVIVLLLIITLLTLIFCDFCDCDYDKPVTIKEMAFAISNQ